MTRQISRQELSRESGDIVRRLAQGESFVVTQSGIPVAELTPFPRRRFVKTEVAIALFQGAPRVDYQRLRSDLDGLVDQDPHRSSRS